MPILPSDWGEIFAIHTPIAELMVRSVVLYLGILVLMRILPRRSGGEVARMDLIFMLLIAQGAAGAFGDYTSVTEGMVVILTLVSLDYLLNMLSFRFPAIERLVSAPPVEVVRDGVRNRPNLKREFITEEELASYLRQNGITDISQVKLAVIEGKGKVSIITQDASD